MAQAKAKIRLYVQAPLGPGQQVALSRDQAHYLFGVMRQGVGDGVLIFNGTDGEWLAKVAEAGKRAGVLVCDRQTAPQRDAPDVWLCFAPIKKAFAHRSSRRDNRPCERCCPAARALWRRA